MFRFCILFLFITAAATLPVAAQSESDTLTAGVFPPKPTVLKGATRDLTHLEVNLITLPAGLAFDAESDGASHLLIVKSGRIVISAKALGPGGIGLFDTLPYISNTGNTKATFYLFSFQSRSGSGHQAAAGFIRDWPDLVMKSTPKGESRAIFNQPTTWLKNINMHATTLNPGEISHPQHMHRAEEILLLRSGTVRMHIGDHYVPAKGGDLVFLPSGVPHDLENGNTGRTEYFALQWEQ